MKEDTNNNVQEELDDDLLRLSVLHLMVLQRLTIIKNPIVRFQLMQDITNVVGSKKISTARFYRILEKLESLNLVSYRDTGNGQLEYFIVEKGINTLQNSQKMISQTSTTVFAYLDNQIEKIIQFTGKGLDRILFVEFSTLLDFNMLNELKEHTKKLHLLITSQEKIQWFEVNTSDLYSTMYSEGIIREPDSFFDLVVVVNSSVVDDKSIYSEFYRVLKSGGKLALIDIENPKEHYDHFVIDALLNSFHPFFDSSLNGFQSVYEEVEQQYEWKEIDKLELSGLHINRLEKP
jgi:DNA-binding PadR family transcriptional regulator